MTKTYVALQRIELSTGKYAEKGERIRLPDDAAQTLLSKGRITPLKPPAKQEKLEPVVEPREE